jgi:hypothetical protein
MARLWANLNRFVQFAPSPVILDPHGDFGWKFLDSSDRPSDSDAGLMPGRDDSSTLMDIPRPIPTPGRRH